MTLVAARPMPRLGLRGHFGRRMRKWTAVSGFTLFGLMIASAYLMPLGYMAATSLKDGAQMSDAAAPLYPAKPATFAWEGQEYPIYNVPTADGATHRWALVDPRREDATFVDPAHPETAIEWQGRWRALEQAWEPSLNFDNFATVWQQINFGRLLLNTFLIAIIGTLGTLLSSTAVAYGFSRFRFPARNGLFLLLVSTIILPFQITLIPTFAVFSALGWIGTWLPLLIPHFFANAYNVFLLRQYFLTIPRELDEAAMLDGASPLRVLLSVIIPQSLPVLTAVGLFHFFFAWNDFFQPLIYLQGSVDAQPLSVGIASFNALFSQKPTLIQAAAMMSLVLPVIVFFIAQRAFMRGIVITGVEK
ncbi:MAG TPA: carbohydrate ABC transporter permease [Candidatus Limnocylindrales bacterium]|nr:carbohydrate ABC transporter permease [Candidatus Limnocylindrales bacterium]